MKISVHDERHARLENEVGCWLLDNGFIHASATYHDVMNDDIQKRLGQIYDPTSLYIRTRADRIAVHKTLPFSFQWEVKTKPPSRRDPNKGHGVDMTVEAYPLAQHIFQAKLGVKTLYIYGDSFQDLWRGFWVHHLPTIREIKITSRGAGIAAYLKSVYVDTKITEGGSYGGSNDPFCIIDVSTIESLPHWQRQIKRAIDHYSEGLAA